MYSQLTQQDDAISEQENVKVAQKVADEETTILPAGKGKFQSVSKEMGGASFISKRSPGNMVTRKQTGTIS